MKSKKVTNILWRALVATVLCSVIWLTIQGFLRHGCFSLGIEPRYEGKPLRYWCEHAFDWFGSKKTPNADATKALQSMKNDALPFLVKWIATMNHSSQGTDYESLALNGFEILGPDAVPAIPGLFKVIGRNNNWPSSALGHIGAAAVPALIELLTTNQSPDFYGNWRKGIPDNTIRANAIGVLGYIGTNAQAALPVLMSCYKDEEKRSHGNMAWALASVGHNQPEIVVPALTYLLTNSSNRSKYEVPEALASFGNAAKSAIPELLAVSRTADDQFKATIGIAIKKIEPERPDALQPLIANLSSADASLRESALFQIEQISRNAPDILEAMRKMAVQESNPDWRSRILDWLAKNETNKEALHKIVQINLTNENESVVNASIECLGVLAADSQAGFDELLAEFNTQQNNQLRENARTCLYLTTRMHPEYLITCLNSSQGDVSYSAMRFMHSLSRDTLVIISYTLGTSTNERPFVMKEIDEADKKLLQNTIPILVQRLRDEKADMRQLATNVLLELNPKAAKQAGVQVVMPYLYYAN